MVFSPPVEIFIFALSVSLVFVFMAFLTNPRKHWIIITSGLFFSIFSMATDGVDMGDRISSIVATPTTMNLTGSTVSVPDYSYNVITGGTAGNIDGGGTNAYARAELFQSGSPVIGDTIQCINVAIQDIGTSSVGNITAGVFGATGNLVFTIDIINASITNTARADFYEFCLPDGESYTIQTNDRIGITYPFDTTNNGISARIDGSNPFDGTNSNSQGVVTTSWIPNTAGDLTMQMYSYNKIANTIQVSGLGGVYDYEDKIVPFDGLMKTLFTLIGGFICISSVLLLWKEP